MKPLSNAANTLGTKRTTNTSKKTKIQALASKNQPVKPSTKLALTARRSTTTASKVIKPRKTTQTTKSKAATTTGSSSSAAIVVPTPAVVIVPFKLQFDTRWNREILSDGDTSLADSNRPWAVVLKEMDETIIPRLEGRGTALFYPWKIRALITSTGARGLRQTGAVTLARTEGAGERWERAMDLIRINARSGMKDLSIVVESIWTSDGNEPEPEAPPSYDAAAVPNSTPTPRSRRSERSQQQTTSYFDERALFWDAITEHYICQRPNHCHVNARRGLACLEHEGQHYEILFSTARKWRDEVREGLCTLEAPSRSVIQLIVRKHQQHEAELAKTLARGTKTVTQTSPSTPATVNHIYVNPTQQQAPTAAPIAPPEALIVNAPRHVSPIPGELNAAANREAFWDLLKQAYPDWSAGFDRVKVQLEQDYWNLRLVFQSSDKHLSRVVKQSGLRIVIHEELSIFVDMLKQAHRVSTSSIATSSRAPSGH
jgi:hypothetical protein